MNMNSAPSGERLHIGFFGCRNAGKSSLVNAVTGQELSVVSEIRGTTTDPVRKAMELLPLGPVVITDTPGFDDEGLLGELRVERTREVLRQIDIAVLVVDASAGMTETDAALLRLLRERSLPHLIAWNKSDLPNALPPAEEAMAVSALTGEGIHDFKERLAHLQPQKAQQALVRDLIQEKDVVLLICPIDESAPKGRLILPQQQAIRDIMEKAGLPLVVRETEIGDALASLKNAPALVITDSQAFKIAARCVPDEIPLTSFSILMARYKGFLETAVRGISALSSLKDGDKILMAEGCTHHRQCNDIGTVKIPRLLRSHTGASIVIETSSGRDFPEDLTPYRLVIHCGGCMLTDTVMQLRMRRAVEQGVPFTNYGIALAMMTGTLERSLRIFPQLHRLICGPK